MPNLKWTSIAAGGTTIGLLGAWTGARRPARDGLLRERMLDVAEVFVVLLRAGEQCVLHPHDGEPRLAECLRIQDDLWQLLVRIELLYGLDSKVLAHASEATGALATIEVLVRQEACGAPDMALRERIDVEGVRPLERELRGFLRAVRAELRVGGRRPLAARIGRRTRATRSRTPSLDRRRVRRPRAEQAQSDDLLREIEELQRSFENGAARTEGVAEAPEAPPPE